MSHAPLPGPCRAFLNDFSAFVDGEVSVRRRDEIQAHVDCCQACLDHLTAYRRGITVLRSIEAQAPADFWTRLEQRLWLGPELTIHGGGQGKARRRGPRWSLPAASLAAAAVLGLFVVARGLGPGSPPVQMGPERIQASVAMTLPTVPGSQEARTTTLASAGPNDAGRSPARSSRRAAPAVETAYAPGTIDPRAGSSIEEEIRRFEERILERGLGRGSEGTLQADGWVQPVRLGNDRWGARLQPASLVRPATSVRPAPWNVDRALNLP